MKKKGFTLVELLVVMMIIIIFLGISIPAYRRFERINQLNLTAQQVKDAILEAKNYSLSPRKEKLAGIDTYYINIAPGGNVVKYVTGEGQPDATNPTLAQERQIASSMNFDNHCWIKFSISGQGEIPTYNTDLNLSGYYCQTNITDNGILGNIMTIPIRHLKSNEIKYIKINLTTGEAKIQ